MTAATIAYGVLLLFVASSRPDQCQRYPFWPSPEMYYDYHTCSTVIDWSNFIDKTCRENFVRYEVQLAVNGCTPPYSTYITTNERFDLQYYIPGGCLADSNCYARVRAQLREGNSWSDYSPWIGLSNTFKMVQGNKFESSCICMSQNAKLTISSSQPALSQVMIYVCLYKNAVVMHYQHSL